MQFHFNKSIWTTTTCLFVDYAMFHFISHLGMIGANILKPIHKHLASEFILCLWLGSFCSNVCFLCIFRERSCLLVFYCKCLPRFFYYFHTFSPLCKDPLFRKGLHRILSKVYHRPDALLTLHYLNCLYLKWNVEWKLYKIVCRI